MTDQVPNKLPFLVRCPKCLCILPEPPNVSVYQCGGCGAFIKAKKRNITSGDAEPLITESIPLQTNEPENISNDEESDNFSQVATLSLTGHHPVETDCESSQTEIQVCSREPPLDSESSPEISKKLMHLRNKMLTRDDGRILRRSSYRGGFRGKFLASFCNWATFYGFYL